MILHALYQYYNEVVKTGKLAPLGMSFETIPFIIVITKDGTFVRIEDTRGTTKKTKDGTQYLVAQAIGRTSGIAANPLWDKPLYTLEWEAEEGAETPHLNAFKAKVSALCEAYPDIDEFQAVKLFYAQEDQVEACKESFARFDLGKKKSNYMSFRLNTEYNPNQLVAGNRILASETLSSEEADTGVCLVTGQSSATARLHKEVPIGGRNISLVNFNTKAYNSYGKEQGANAPISIEVANAYAKGLEHLLTKDQPTNYRIGDMVLVFWNAHPNDDLLDAYKQITFAPKVEKNTEEEEDDQVEEEAPTKKRRKSKKAEAEVLALKNTYKLYDTLKAVYGGKDSSLNIETTEQFYILGLVPGTGRISVKLWQTGSIREIVGNTLQHLDDMNIVQTDGLLDIELPPTRSLDRIVSEVSPPSKKKNRVDSLSYKMIQEIVESIISGTPYPISLQQACIERLRHNTPITELRAAILKACINRKARFHRNYPHKELHMALDKQNDNIAYLAGRLFAVLEQIQQASLGKGVNATIRDRFFASASTRPNTVLGRLISLSNHHLSKLRKEKPGLAITFEKLLGEIFDLIPASVPTFPATLSLDEQSIFAVGYYHQKTDSFKKDNNTKDQQESEQ